MCVFFSRRKIEYIKITKVRIFENCMYMYRQTLGGVAFVGRTLQSVLLWSLCVPVKPTADS